MTALRQEVNLQTRAARAQQEQNASALGQLQEALELLQRREAAAAQDAGLAAEEQLRPLLRTLVDLHDALSLALREVQRVQDALEPVLEKFGGPPLEVDDSEPPAPPAAPPRRSFWARVFGGAPPEPTAALTEDVLAAWRERLQRQRAQLAAARDEHAEARQAAERTRQFLSSVIAGYIMSVQRLERALQQHQLEAIPCVGEPFDPETMEVVEVTAEPGRMATEVVEEVRRGYRWRGRVFRFAQVRVARPI
jgi:molecular chaperone GrpE